MLDNDLIRAFLPILTQGLIDYGIGSVTVRQAYQPTQTGTESLPVITFFKVSDSRPPWAKKIDFYDFSDDQYKHEERQVYETVFQMNSLSAQNPTDANSLTASDILNTALAVMQSDTTIQQLKNQEIGILRVSDIRNVPFVDDRDQYEYSPSFDFTLRHLQQRTSPTDFITDFDQNIFPITC